MVDECLLEFYQDTGTVPARALRGVVVHIMTGRFIHNGRYQRKPNQVLCTSRVLWSLQEDRKMEVTCKKCQELFERHFD